MKKLFKKGDTLVEILFAVAVFGLVAILTISTMNRGVQNAQSSLEQTTTRTEIDAQAEALRFINNAYAAQRNLGESNEYYTELWKKITSLAGDPETLGTADVLTCSSVYDPSNDKGVFSSTNPAFVINTRLLYDQNIVKEHSSNVVITARGDAGPKTDIFAEASLYPRLIYGESNPDGSLVAAASGDSADNLTEDYGMGYKALKSAEGVWVTAVYAEDESEEEDQTYYDFYIRSCWYAPGSDTASTIGSTIRLYNPDVSVAQAQKQQFDLVYHNLAGDSIATYSRTSKLPQVNFRIQQGDPGGSSLHFIGWRDADETPPTQSYYTMDDTQRVFIANPTDTSSNPAGHVESSKTYISIGPGTTNLVPTYGYKYTVRYHYNYTHNGRTYTCHSNQTEEYYAPGRHQYPLISDASSNCSGNWYFEGWSTTPGGTAISGGRYSMPTGETTIDLYAVWGGYHYRLVYNRNSGSDAVTGMPSNYNSGLTRATSRAVTVADVRGSIWRDNTSGQCYTFTGWATSPSGSAAYVGGETITLTPSNEVVNLYAVWHPNSGTGRCFTYLVRLDWGANPSDLDSHLTATGYSEIYYGNTGDCASGNLCLDLDDTSGFGPETISIITEPNKTYTYFVHHFSGTSSIGTSPTTVTLSHGNGHIIRTYTAPSSQTADWYPFRITTNASGVATITNL